MATKQCKGCERVLEASKDNFYGHPAFSDGLDNRCKDCRKAERLAKIKERHGAMKKGSPAGGASASTARPPASKPSKKDRKMDTKPREQGVRFQLDSDRIIREIVDVANVIHNGRALLRQKAKELTEALDREASRG